MKKLLFLIPLLIISCQKKETVSESSATKDSAISANLDGAITDSSKNGVVVMKEEKPKEISDTFRVIKGDSIIKTINGDMIPLTISDEFTTEKQKFILKIKNFTGKKIMGTVNATDKDMNIRFNQIKLPNGELDGPFGREINYDVKQNGEIWLIIGKSLMASGKSTGKFTITLK